MCGRQEDTSEGLCVVSQVGGRDHAARLEGRVCPGGRSLGFISLSQEETMQSQA